MAAKRPKNPPPRGPRCRAQQRPCVQSDLRRDRAVRRYLANCLMLEIAMITRQVPAASSKRWVMVRFGESRMPPLCWVWSGHSPLLSHFQARRYAQSNERWRRRRNRANIDCYSNLAGATWRWRLALSRATVTVMLAIKGIR